MKKLVKMAAVLAALAMVMGGMISCSADSSDDSGSGSTSGTTSGTTTATFKAFSWNWEDYQADFGATGSTQTMGLGEDGGYKTAGVVTIGDKVKYRNTYVQLSNGKAGSLMVTLLPGVSSVTVNAKIESGKKIKVCYYDEDSSSFKELADLTPATADTDYAEHTASISVSAETVVYIGTFTESTSCNFKGFAFN